MREEKETLTWTSGIVQELFGVRINADDIEWVAAILAVPFGDIRIHREAPILSSHIFLHKIQAFYLRLYETQIHLIFSLSNSFSRRKLMTKS